MTTDTSVAEAEGLFDANDLAGLTDKVFSNIIRYILFTSTAGYGRTG